MPVPLPYLAVFHAVAEAGSVTRAAGELMVSQPAVSKQIKALERSLQVRLFDRWAKGVRLTAAGRTLADYAARIFSLVVEAESALADASAMRRGTLAVGASRTVGTYLFPAALVYFRRRFPGISLRVEVGDARALRERLLEGSLDLALTEADGVTGWPDLQTTVIGYDELVSVAHPAHPLARKRSVSAEALCREPFVVRDTGSDTRSLVERSLAAAGHVLNPVLSLGSTEAIKQAVAAGMGVAMVSKMAAAGDVAARRLAVLRLAGVSVRRPLYYVRARSREETKAAVAFRCVLKHAVRGSLPERVLGERAVGEVPRVARRVNGRARGGRRR